MEKKIRSFSYKEFGSKETSKSFYLERNDSSFSFKISNDKNVYLVKANEVDEIFKKYDFSVFDTLESYPFKLKDQVDYLIKIEYNDENITKEITGYSHYPEFFNDFILDLHKLVPSRSVKALKVKEEMLDKDDYFITNYVEKISVYVRNNTFMISLDKFNDSEYEVDIEVPALTKFFKKNDFDFLLPINCHYFTYIINKICGFAHKGTSRKGNYEDYIDIRLANKKHKYFEVNEESIKGIKILFSYLNLYYKLPLFNAFIDENFEKDYIESHKKPKSKNEVREEFEELAYKKGLPILDSLKMVAKNNQNFSMYDLVAIAYKAQKSYFIYLFDKNDKNSLLKEVEIPAQKEKSLAKYFKYEYLSDLSIIDLSKDYDAYYYIKDNIYHMIIVSSRYSELEYLKLEDKFIEQVVDIFKSGSERKWASKFY